jgi:uncharacterized repeat protein (TIGR01451 family)
VLGPGLSYPPITLTVNVAGNAGPTVTNVVTVSGGGDTSAGNNTASDPTAIAVVDPAFIDLTVTKAHENLTVGQTGVTYTVTVTNVGTAATVGTVIVTDEIPAGLTATALSGPGWACAVTPARCTRSDPLAPGASYPPITVTVTVDAGAGPTVTNVVTVSGGGDTITGNNTASDPTAISSVPIPLLSPAGLVVLVALLVLAGATSLRARQRARVVADEAGRR